MNKIERALIERGKRILIEYAAEELENYKNKLAKMPKKTLLDIFNSGILLDVNKIQTQGIEHLQNQIKRRNKTK